MEFQKIDTVVMSQHSNPQNEEDFSIFTPVPALSDFRTYSEQFQDLVKFENDSPYKMTCYSWIFVVMYLVFFTYAFLTSYEMFILTLLPITPLIPFMVWWTKNREHLPIYEVIRCFGDGTVANIGCSILTNIFMSVIFEFTDADLTQPLILLTSTFLISFNSEVLKMLAFKINNTHQDIAAGKRQLIVSTIISIGFAFTEGLFISFCILQFNEFGWITFSEELELYFITTLVMGTPLNILCGYLSGLILTVNSSNFSEALLYTIPARTLYVFGEITLVQNPTRLNLYVVSVTSTCSIVFVILCIRFYVNYIPEFQHQSYLELIGYSELPVGMEHAFDEETPEIEMK